MGSGVKVGGHLMHDPGSFSLILSNTRGVTFLFVYVLSGHQKRTVPLKTCAYSKPEVRKRVLSQASIFLLRKPKAFLDALSFRPPWGFGDQNPKKVFCGHAA